MQARRRQVQGSSTQAQNEGQPRVPDLWTLVNRLHDVLGTCKGRLRIELLVHLLSEPRSVSDLTARCESSKPDVSKALSGLMAQQLVRFRQRVTKRFYEITENVDLAWHPQQVEVRVLSGGLPTVGVYLPKDLVCHLHPTLTEPVAIQPRFDLQRIVVVPFRCQTVVSAPSEGFAGTSSLGQLVERRKARTTHIPGRDVQ